jgi:hypothetical protein
MGVSREQHYPEKTVSLYSESEEALIQRAIEQIRNEQSGDLREGEALAKACRCYLRKQAIDGGPRYGGDSA